MKKVYDKIKANTWVFGILCIILPFVMSIFFSVPSADDFTEAEKVSSKGAAFITAIKGANYMWLNWGGQWPVQFIEICFNPLTYFRGTGHAIGIVLIFTFLLWVLLIYFFIKNVLKTFVGVENNKIIRAVFAFTLIALLNSGIYTEIFYWFVGNCYLWEFEFILLNLIFIVKYSLNCNVKNGIILSLIGFIACFGYMYAISAGIFYLIVMYDKDMKSIKSFINRFYPLVFMIIGGCLAVFAPGNFARHRSFDDEVNIVVALLRSVSETVKYYVEMYSNVVFLLCMVVLFIIPIMFPDMIEKKIKVSPIILIASQIISTFGVIFCVSLGYGDAYIPNRIDFIINSTIVFWSSISFFALGKYISNREDMKNDLVRKVVALFVLVLIMVNSNLEKNYLHEMPWIKTLEKISAIAAESRYYRGIIKKIETCKDTYIIIEDNSGDIPEETGIIKNIGLTEDEECWINAVISRYYGLEKVIYIVND